MFTHTMASSPNGELMKVHLQLTLDQYTAIRQLFLDNNWDIDEALLEEIVGNYEKPKKEDSSNNDDSDDGNAGPVQPGNINLENACEHCFMDPCAASPQLRQAWLGQGRQAHRNNSFLRRQKYKHYWTLIQTMGGWGHPMYLEKKTSVTASTK